ncbi:MAG: transcription elongation factor GreA [Caldilineaceae bacterium]|nr:transcription elongation factor GreA [Caldilineaceae bacterium]
MSESPVYLTQSGLDALQEELDYLVGERRQEIAQQIAEAKAEGDLRENAGYDEAKNAQAFVEGRIRELKVKIHNAQIIDESETPDNLVALGRRVVVRESGYNDEEVYTIVGSTETDPTNGRISNESPIGKALIGRTAGEVVRVEAPAGEIEFEIVRVEG